MKRTTVFSLSPLKITALYLVFGAVWIGTTDTLVVVLFDSAETITFLQTIKGWLFVGLSGLLVYGLTHTHHRQHETSERRLQTASQQLQVLHRFIRHNIRNDLNVVLARTELAMDRVADAQEQASLETVQQKAENIVQMSDKLQAVNTLDLNGTDDAVDLTDITADSINTVRQQHPDVDISTELPETAPVRGDYTIYEAVVEVLENAIEHSPHPPESCDISVTITRQNGHATLEVSDNGSSIPQHEVDALQAETESDLLHMSGVGLWMVKWVCECHGGEITVETDAAEGTTVVLEFERTDTSLVVDQLSGTAIEAQNATA